MSDAILTRWNGNCFEIRFNRPKQLNALNVDLLECLVQAVAQAKESETLRCVVLQGEGEHFMAGGDIAYFHELLKLPHEVQIDRFRSLIARVHSVVEDLASLPVPVIASVRGAAAGFGLSLVAGCDLAVASETAFFTSSYNLLGTSPDGGSTYYAGQALGFKKAMEVMLTAKRYDAAAALEMGLVNQIAADDALEAGTAQLAFEIAQSAARAVTHTKRLIRHACQNSLAAQLRMETDLFLECIQTDDFAEGVQAFMNKRKPRFKN